MARPSQEAVCLISMIASSYPIKRTTAKKHPPTSLDLHPHATNTSTLSPSPCIHPPLVYLLDCIPHQQPSTFYCVPLPRSCVPLSHLSSTQLLQLALQRPYSILAPAKAKRVPRQQGSTSHVPSPPSTRDLVMMSKCQDVCISRLLCSLV